MPYHAINRRDFLKIGATAAGAALIPGSRCAYLNDSLTHLPTKRIFVCSDIHIGYEEGGSDGEVWLTKALSDLNAIGTIDYALVLGDITHNGIAEELQRYVSVRNRSSITKWYEVAGNHEYFNGDIESYYSLVTPYPSYMVCDGNIVWFFLSDEQESPEGNISDKTLVWFINQLSRNRDKIIIVSTHQCVYDTVRDSKEDIRHLYPRQMIAEILNTFRIDLWLCGHQHYYPFSSADMYYDGKTTFINVSSLNHGYDTLMSQSVILDLNQNAREITAYRRSHDLHAFDDQFTVTIQLPFPVKLSEDTKRIRS